MKPQANQKRLELTQEELDRVLRRKRQDRGTRVTSEDLFIAEFGYYYGWGGVLSIVSDEIAMEDAKVLLEGARKVWKSQLVDMASVMFTSTAAAQSGKKANKVMNDGLRSFIKQSRADA